MKIIVMRNGMEFGVADDNYQAVVAALQSKRFLVFDGVVINTADVSMIVNETQREKFKKHQAGLIETKTSGWVSKNEYKISPFLGLSEPEILTSVKTSSKTIGDGLITKNG